jgi:cytochrome c553
LYQQQLTPKIGQSNIWFSMSIQTSAFFFFAAFSVCLHAAPVETLTEPCAKCHGPAGVSTQAKTAHLNGQLSDYLEEDISGIANGGRATSIPNHIPRSWTAQEISTVAKFYATSKATRPAPYADAALAAKGEALYKKRCADCHPDSGRGSDHDAPLLAAQDLDYLVEQVRAFVSGKRKFVFLMDDAFRGLSLAELESIAHFFAAQDQFKK